MATSQTKRSTPRLSDLARHVVVPSGVAGSGWPSVEAQCARMGVVFRPWQPDTGRLVLAKRADGKYAATIGGTGLSFPRQVGKTFLVGAIVFALCILRPNLTVIWTAHRLRTAEETFGKMQAFAKRAKVAAHVRKLVLGSGEEAVLFKNGSRILFGARESGFGLGFDEVDVLIFDEAQRLKDQTLTDMVPATNQSRQATSALLLFMGTPPRPTDAGEVWTRMRLDALTGEDGDTGWVEFGADPDFHPTPAPAPLTQADWAQVRKANPSYPHDTPREAILRMRKQLGHEAFVREGFGIWDDGTTVQPGDVDLATWAALADPAAERGTELAFGVDVSEDRTACIAVAWRREDGGTQVMLTVDERGRVDVALPVTRVPGRIADLLSRWGGSVTVGGPAVDLTDEIDGPVQVATAADFATGCGLVADGIAVGALFHGNQPELNSSVRVARWRSVGVEGQRAWQLRNAAGISPLAAVTRAVQGLSVGPSVYEDRGLVTL